MGTRVLVSLAGAGDEPFLDPGRRKLERLLADERVDVVVFEPEGRGVAAEARGTPRVRVLRSPLPASRGASHKLGCRLAVDEGYGFVVPVFAAPGASMDLIPALLHSWQAGGADVVLASPADGGGRLRQLGWKQLEGLTLGLGLGACPGGLRGYSVSFLERVPFELDGDDDTFDTEILLQAVWAQARIEEVHVPAPPGSLPGAAAAAKVLARNLEFRLHRVGMFCSLKYRDLAPVRYRDKTHVLYSSHQMALRIVESTRPKRVLDLGCGPGFIARRCAELGAEVTGVDVSEPLPGSVARFVRADLERDPLPVDVSDFDLVLLLDVIEHLRDPERFLLDLRNRARMLRSGSEAPLFVVSTPNVAFAAVRLNLALGRFPYAERGILDITHKRLFTRDSLLRALRDTGYVVEDVLPVPVPFEAVLAGPVGQGLGSVSAALARSWSRLFAFQFLVTCRPLPGIGQILSHSTQQAHA